MCLHPRSSYLWLDSLGAQTRTKWRTVQPSRAWWANSLGYPSPEVVICKEKWVKNRQIWERDPKSLLMWVKTGSSGRLEVVLSTSDPAPAQSFCSELGSWTLWSPRDDGCMDGWAEETKRGGRKRGMRDGEPVEFWLGRFLLHGVTAVARLKKLLRGV